MDKVLPKARADEEEEIVPISDLDSIFSGNRALRRKFLSNLRRRVKKAKKETQSQLGTA